MLNDNVYHYNPNIPLASVFKRVMGAEGKVMRTLYGNEKVKCFFRKQSDGVSSTDYMIMYYPSGSPVSPGTLLVYKNKIFLTLNQETTENRIYYKSAIVRTNGILTTNTLSVLDLPFYGDTLSLASANDESYYNILNGRLQIKTQDCEKSRALSVSDKFNVWGRTFRIDNIYYTDGIAYIVLSVVEDEILTLEYTVQLSDLSFTSVVVGQTDKIEAKCFVNDIELDASVIYGSSDTSVATIDDEGNIVYVGAGEVYFNACWVEQDIEVNTPTVTCFDAEEDVYNLSVATVGEIYYGFKENIEYAVTKNGEIVSDIPITFSVEFADSSVSGDKVLITDYGSYIQILVDDDRLVNKTFTLIAQNDEYGLYSSQDILIRGFF
ncbi:MAG: hypothetical protein LUC88_10185 [Prevotella sp.]|nr:hypothetical protein [Prevotella sp.]